jgi:hypothetical protein
VQRWLAVAGVAAVVVLAVGSLGGQFLSQEGGSAVDAAPDATGESDTIPVFTDDNRAPAAEAFAVHVASYRDAVAAGSLRRLLPAGSGRPRRRQLGRRMDTP